MADLALKLPFSPRNAILAQMKFTNSNFQKWCLLALALCFSGCAQAPPTANTMVGEYNRDGDWYAGDLLVLRPDFTCESVSFADDLRQHFSFDSKTQAPYTVNGNLLSITFDKRVWRLVIIHRRGRFAIWDQDDYNDYQREGRNAYLQTHPTGPVIYYQQPIN